MKKILIIGKGGSGVKYMAYVLAVLLANKNWYSTIIYNYDAAVRGGLIEARVVASEKPVTNPYLKKANLIIKLAKTKTEGTYKAKIFLYEKNLNTRNIKAKLSKEINFQDISLKLFNTKQKANMIALGGLLKICGFVKNIKELKKLMPKLDPENIRAVEEGFKLKEVVTY